MTWTYSSHASLQEAGYTWRSSGICELCWQRILWYTNVDRKLVPINPGTYMIHFATCEKRQHRHADPDPKKVINFGARRQRQFQLFVFEPPDKGAA